MSKIQEELEKRQSELRRFAQVVGNNRRTVDLAVKCSFLTQAIKEISR